jgi:hypothetical protein
MADAVTLKRRAALPVALDYAALRAEGMDHIRALSGLTWTDHNLHDPGITTLEILCFALTDLAYRASFPTADLLTGPDGRIDPPALSGLVPAHEALTTAPRTIADYRRLLLRIEGVRNAWLDPMTDPERDEAYRLSEVPIFADCLEGALTYDAAGKAGDPTHPVRLSGLYRVLVELEIDDRLGSLNDDGLTFSVRRGALRGVLLRFELPEGALPERSLLASDIAAIDQVAVSGAAGGGFRADIDVTLADGRKSRLEGCRIRARTQRTRPGHPPIIVTAQAVRAVLAAATADGLVPMFWEKLQRRTDALVAIECVLHAHRGLCEDYLSIATVAAHRIGICADVEVTADADLERVQAEVFHAIETYLSPPLRYSTLQEMLDAGLQPDAIFNTPFIDFGFTCGGDAVFTKPGFITDADLAATELRTEVRASDIINAVSEIEGVEAIRNLQLRPYDRFGNPAGPSASWLLKVPSGRQPAFFQEGSKLLFHRAGIPFRAQASEFERTLDYLRGAARRDVYVAPDQTLPMPAGRRRDLAAYESVQHDFPETYRIGRAGISQTEGAERIAKARQFKGYLTIFDQLLADFLGQLANLRILYSLRPDLSRTWFSQFVDRTAGSLGTFADEFYIDKDATGDDLQRARLTESDEAFLERRSRALDHMVARFGERFPDHVTLAFRESGDRLAAQEALIQDKIRFLADHPALSRSRGQGANVRPEDPAQVWDSANVSGFERRAGRLLGIDDLSRRDLRSATQFDALFAEEGNGGAFRVRIDDAGGQALFTSAETFPDAATASAAAEKLYAVIREEEAFHVAETQGATTFTLTGGSGASALTHAAQFDTEADAFRAARAVVDRYDEILALEGDEAEGMHVIEHILLRPRALGDALLPICLPDECSFCGEEDPYSFRVSVVLPYWPRRFRDLDFRALVERTLREEAPAHVQVKICWIGQAQMAEVDRAHRGWLDALAAEPRDPARLRLRAGRLIDILSRLRSVYPAANLHDCDAGEDETIVRLGSTALGIF